MAGKGRSIENVQNNVLAMFNIDKNRTTTFVEDQIALSKKKRLKEEKLRGGLSVEEYDKLKKEQAKLNFEKSQQAELSRNRKAAQNIDHYHTLLQEFYSIFGTDLIDYNKETLEDKPSELKGLTIYNHNETIVTIEKARLNKGCLQLIVNIEYQKQIFVKAADFETTKNVEKSFKTVIETAKVKCPYGKVIDFRNGATTGFSEIIKKYGIENLNTPTAQTVKNVWSF